MAADCAIELKVSFLPFHLLPGEAEFEALNLGPFIDSSSNWLLKPLTLSIGQKLNYN